MLADEVIERHRTSPSARDDRATGTRITLHDDPRLTIVEEQPRAFFQRAMRPNHRLPRTRASLELLGGRRESRRARLTPCWQTAAPA